MKHLLKTNSLDISLSANKDLKSILTACQNDSENLYIAAYLTNGKLQLWSINARHPTSPTTRHVDWKGTGYKDLCTLCFDTLGCMLLAATSHYINIIPFSSYMKSSTGQNKVEDIRLPSMAGVVTCSVWWRTALNKDIAIIGTDKGELVFVNIAEKKCVHRSQVSGHLIRLEVVPDDRQHTTYLLISGRSSLQWRMLLDVYDRDLHMTHNEASMSDLGYMFYGGRTYIKSILHSRTYSYTQSEFSPRRFTNIPIAVSLRYQSAKGCHLLSAVDKRDNSLKIYDSNAEHLPLFEYSLPFWSEQVIYTDRLIFSASSNQHVLVLANHLSEKDSLHNQGGHVLYREALEDDEPVKCIFAIKYPSTWYTDMKGRSAQMECSAKSHTILDGCVVITDRRIMQIVPNLSPEQLFLNWSTEAIVNIQSLETLARVTHIDILDLCVQSAEYHLKKDDLEKALDCLAYSKCDAVTQIKLLHIHAHYDKVITMGNDLLLESGEQSSHNLSNTIRCDVSNMVLESYIYGTSDLSSRSQFREFLLYNTDYSLNTAMKLLCEQGAVSLLIQVSIARKFLHGALEHAFKQEKITPDVLHEFIDVKEFTSAIDSVMEGAILYLLSPADLSTYLLYCDTIRLSALHIHIGNVSLTSTESLGRLVRHYHPYSVHTRRNMAKYQKSLESTAALSYASAVQESDDMDSNRPSLSDYTTSLYLFYVKLLLELSTRSEHSCLLRKNLDKLNTDLEKRHSPHKLQRHDVISMRRAVICCNGTTVYSLQRSGLFTWGSKAKMDDLTIEDRVANSTPTALTLPNQINITEVTSVSCGDKHLMLLCADGSLYGYGSSQYGQVGAGACSEHTELTKLSHLPHIVNITCGRYHTLAINKHGRLYSWGWGLFGQLGHGDVENCDTPRLVEDLQTRIIVSVAAGHAHSLALTSEGEIYAFGSNTFGQVDATISVPKVTSPYLMKFSSAAQTISTKYFHNVAVFDDGEVLVWGIHPVIMKRKAHSSASSGNKAVRTHAHNEAEKTVQDLRGPRAISLTGLLSSEKIVQVACGASTALFLTSGGSVYSWEESSISKASVDSPSGTGNLAEQASKMASLENITYIQCDQGFYLALSDKGLLQSWGKNDYGQLGLALRNIRLVQNPASVKIPKHQQVQTTLESLHRIEISDCLHCITTDSEGGSGHARSNTQPAYYEEPRQTCDLLLELGWLCRLEEAFPISQSLALAVSRRIYTAAVSLFRATGCWSEACFYHLKSLIQCQGHLGSEYTSNILDVVIFYVVKVADQASNQPDYVSSRALDQIMFRLLQFWQAKQLPVRPELEERLLIHEKLLSPSLCKLLISPSEGESVLPESFTHSFSSDFLARITRSAMKNMTANHKGEDKTMAWNNVVKQIRKGLASKPSTTVSQFDLHRLISETASTDNPSSACDIIVFTCGHHYNRQSFDSKILDSFESRIVSKLPVTGGLILEKYRGSDCISLACPPCVQTSLQHMIA